MTSPDQTLEAVYRAEWGRLLALLLARTRRLDLVEDALGEAFARAAEHWKLRRGTGQPLGLSGNVAGDVAGGLRTPGDATVVNRTISGNTSTVWHGGALFATDGTVAITNSTIVGNNAPSGTAGGLMVATFGASVDVSVANSIVADQGTYNYQIEGGDPAVLTSLGGNAFTDASCREEATDQVVGSGAAGVDGLGDNGGPTLTYALAAGSPAVDAADASFAPDVDQRGVDRPQGAGDDVGSYELTP